MCGLCDVSFALLLTLISIATGSNVLLHSKSFDPRVFLSTVHPNATFKDLNMGKSSPG